jgi:hypothetical protein
MLKLSKAQRQAVKRVYDRGFTYGRNNQAGHVAGNSTAPNTYRQFRATVQPIFCGDGAVALPWCGMWLAIERDGLTHS